MAFGLWFVHLLCEYKPSFAEAIYKTSNFPLAWLICGLFWAVAVCITFELVKAFTIQVYVVLKKKWDTKSNSANGEENFNYHVLAAVYKKYEEGGKRFWKKCLVVDEDEYEGVKTEVRELLEGGHKKDGEGGSRKSSADEAEH